MASSLKRNVAFQMPNGIPIDLDDNNVECRLKRINTPHYKSIRSGTGLTQTNDTSGTLNLD